MRTASLVVLLVVPSLLAQPLSVGVRGGVPLADALRGGGFDNPGSALRYAARTNRYVVGPTVELRLPFSLGVTFDALYRRFGYHATERSGSAVAQKDVSAGQWEFPLMLRYRLPGLPVARPFVGTGPYWNRITGVRQALSCEAALLPICRPGPAELAHTSVFGYAFGAGLEIRAPYVRLSPELRFTRRREGNFQAPILIDVFRSTRNQWDFLLGVTF